jgi:hypothetical protein
MTCPSCGSNRVFPSRLRNVVERIRQGVTGRQPYRCHECGWRRWGDVQMPADTPAVHPDDLRTGREPPPVSPKDLEELDPTNRKP